MHAVSSECSEVPPSPNTHRSWPWSRGLILDEKKNVIFDVLNIKGGVFFLEMDRVKRAFKGMGMRWRPAALGPAWGRAECFMSICLLEMHSSDYDSVLQSNRTHLLETFTHPSFLSKAFI